MSISRIWCAVGCVTLLACSEKKERFESPCANDELEACGLACGTSAPCPSGLHCGADSTCTAECTPSAAQDYCGGDHTCTGEGRCLPLVRPGEGLDGGSLADGGTSAGNDAGLCGLITLDTNPVTPNVILIIDQSSSMDEPFGTSTRWQALKDSLLSETGLVKELEHVVRFGAAFYSGREKAATCPLLTEVELAIDNYQGIKNKYPADTIADTPTGDAIEAVLKKIPEGPVLDPIYAAPTIFVLATDGEPDRCEELNPQNGQQEAIDAVKHAFMRGIRTYIIGVANEVSEKHLQDLANAGVGATNTMAPKYRANDDQGLRNALRTIVGGQVDCKVPLKGKVTGGKCAGTIKVNGKALSCSATDGYEVVENGSALQLTGMACDAIKRGEVLSAMFNCGEAVPLL